MTIKRSNIVRRYRSTGPIPAVVEIVYERDGYACFVCGVPVGPLRGTEHVIHHRRARRSGGSQLPDTNLPQNLILLDVDCHTTVERERTAAYEGGWLVYQNHDPLLVEILWHAESWIKLTAEGRYVHVRDEVA